MTRMLSSHSLNRFILIERSLSNCCLKVTVNAAQWKAWHETDAPEDEPIPGGYDSWMNAFERLLLVRCWCPHRTLHEAQKYISESLGSEYVEAGELDLARLAQDTDCRSPLVGLIAAGIDPTSSIETTAKKLKIGTEPLTDICVSCVLVLAAIIVT